jgi:hypothetical protein
MNDTAIVARQVRFKQFLNIFPAIPTEVLLIFYGCKGFPYLIREFLIVK